MLVLGFKKIIIFRSHLPKLKLTLMQTGGRPHGNPFLIVFAMPDEGPSLKIRSVYLTCFHIAFRYVEIV
jgi:hypothetical protein